MWLDLEAEGMHDFPPSRQAGRPPCLDCGGMRTNCLSCALKHGVLVALEIGTRQRFRQNVGVVVRGVDVFELNVTSINELPEFKVTALDVSSANARFSVLKQGDSRRVIYV